MDSAMRFLRDLFWLSVIVAGTVAVYWLGEATTPVNVIIAAGVAAGLGLGLVAYAMRSDSFDANRSALWDPVSRATALAVLGIPLAVGMLHAGALSFDKAPFKVMPPKATDPLRTILKIDGDRDGDVILFDHAAHQERTGGEEGCIECHHLSKPGDHATQCYMCHADMNKSVSIFSHDKHQAALGGNESCAECHDENAPRSGLSAKACHECHAEDMGMAAAPAGERFDHMAPAYPNAMHSVCVSCHREQAGKRGVSGCLACCDTCHKAVGHEEEELTVR